MSTTERTVLIRARCGEAFALLSDFRNDIRWRQFIRGVEHSPPGLAWLGTRVRETVLLFGVPVQSDCEVIEYEQDRWIVTRPVAGKLGLSSRREVTPHGDGCRCTVVLEFQPEGMMRLLGGLPLVVLRRRLGADLLRLKETLEHPEDGSRSASPDREHSHPGTRM
jgi:hypothetical protein